MVAKKIYKLITNIDQLFNTASILQTLYNNQPGQMYKNYSENVARQV